MGTFRDRVKSVIRSDKTCKECDMPLLEILTKDTDPSEEDRWFCLSCDEEMFQDILDMR
jgi:RNase P subunit RPR2